MTAVRKELRSRRKPVGFLAAFVALAAVLVFAIGATRRACIGGNFEIDGPPSGSNFLVERPGPRRSTGRTSASIAHCRISSAVRSTSRRVRPTTRTRAASRKTLPVRRSDRLIPNNKSDLKTYIMYTEDGGRRAGVPQPRLDPGERPVRHDADGLRAQPVEHALRERAERGPHKGDLLIEYAIDQGGAVATITAREWTGTAWGPATALPDDAIGTINLVPIPANQTAAPATSRSQHGRSARCRSTSTSSSIRERASRSAPRCSRAAPVGLVHVAAEGLHPTDPGQHHELRERHDPQADRPGRARPTLFNYDEGVHDRPGVGRLVPAR